MYNIIHKYEAGISLLGWEVKSLRFNRIDLSGAYAKLKNNEIYALFSIYPLKTINEKVVFNRARKLLLTKIEIKRISSKINNDKSLTLVISSLYWIKDKVKVLLIVGKPKKIYDRRLSIKKREVDRQIRREKQIYR